MTRPEFDPDAPIDYGAGFLSPLSAGAISAAQSVEVNIDYDKFLERYAAVAVAEVKAKVLSTISSYNTQEHGTRSWEDKHRRGDVVKSQILGLVEGVFA